MDGTSDLVIAELISMGFQISQARNAIDEVGPSLNNAIDFILHQDSKKLSTRKQQTVGRMRQSSIMDHLNSARKIKLSRASLESVSRECCEPIHIQPTFQVKDEEECVGADWEVRANTLLQKHFGYPSLKRFQKEALGAWISHKDCLVLAATGSGKTNVLFLHSKYVPFC